jgi:Ca2+-binding RTX toxin-like protein
LLLVSSGIIIIILPMTTTAASAATITGTNGNDVLKGTDSRDTIRARGGDRVYAFKGNDLLYGGRGNDRIWGGSGNDQIYAWHGDNYVSGGEGRETIYATGGPTRPGGPATDDYNRLYGYGGNDRFIIRQASATIYGGSGHDNVDVAADDLARSGGFRIYTGAGNDYVLAAADNGARVYGRPGNDKLISRGESHNYMFGDDGNDYIQIDHDSGTDAHGGPGNDHLVNVFEGRLHGEDGDDVLESRTESARNFMYGGPGADEFRCNGAFDSVEDYNPDEGDTIVGQCESGGEGFACTLQLPVRGKYLDPKTCRKVEIDTGINWVHTLRGVDIGNGDIIDSRLIDSGTVIVDFDSNIPEEGTGNHIELKVDDGPYRPVTSPHTITGLSEAPATHTIYIRGVDAGGGPDLSPAKWTFDIMVINEPPTAQEPIGPANDTGGDGGAGGGGITNVKPPIAEEPIPENENDTEDDDDGGGSSNTTASDN